MSDWVRDMHDYEWIFHALIAFGTLLAVVVALFGDWLKNRWWRPTIKLELLSRLGTFAKAQLLAPDGSARPADARYYHLMVSNPGRWPAATGVQVYLLRIEEPGAGGHLNVIWTGDVPLAWRHQAIHPLARTIGADAHCDLLCVVENKWVEVLTILKTVDFPFTQKRNPFQGVVLTVQARGAETDSKVMRIRISWDGRWNAGDVEMGRHLEVQDVTEPVVTP